MATIMFSALNQRTTPVVDARVEYVSADKLVDDKTQQPYYLTRLRFADLEGTGISLADLYPGMQVDTFVRTTERTFVEYLIRPIRDSFEKAFREN
jgi:multidrug efflux pump subunit AcrA (membrane-fusion protein)